MTFSDNIIPAELNNIKNNAFSVRGYFNLLLTQLLGSSLPNAHADLQVHQEMITEHSLPSMLETKFINVNYLIIFYAQRPNLFKKSPYFPEQETAHTSILLCKIDNEKISNILNIDCYHFPDFVDILGEREGASPNPIIKQRLVINAKDSQSNVIRPLQSPNWKNMNCVLYAFSIVDILLKLNNSQPEVIANVFNTSPFITQEAKEALKHSILSGMVGTYVKSRGGEFYRDQPNVINHHNKIRSQLAANYKLAFIQDSTLSQTSEPNHTAQLPSTESASKPLSAEQLFHLKLNNLKTKIENFKKNSKAHHNYQTILSVSNQLHKKLEEQETLFFKKNSDITAEQFQKNCLELINKATPALEKEPDFLFILIDLAKAFANIVISACSFGTSNHFFKRSTTETENSAKQLQLEVSNLKPSPASYA